MKEFLEEQAMRRTIIRMSHEVLEKNKGTDNIILIGVMTRGIYLANRLADFIEAFEGKRIPCGYLDISNHRDDQKKNLNDNLTDIPFSIEGKKVILVDDVLFKGRTVRAAMDALIDLGRPKEIQLAVLVDRGHREFPIRADYVGKNYPTSLDEDIIVKFREIDGCDGVFVEERK